MGGSIDAYGCMAWRDNNVKSPHHTLTHQKINHQQQRAPLRPSESGATGVGRVWRAARGRSRMSCWTSTRGAAAAAVVAGGMGMSGRWMRMGTPWRRRTRNWLGRYVTLCVFAINIVGVRPFPSSLPSYKSIPLTATKPHTPTHKCTGHLGDHLPNPDLRETLPALRPQLHAAAPRERQCRCWGRRGGGGAAAGAALHCAAQGDAADAGGWVLWMLYGGRWWME